MYLPITQKVINVREAQQTILHLGTQTATPLFFLGGPLAALFPRPGSVVKACGAVGSVGSEPSQHEQELLEDGQVEQEEGVDGRLRVGGRLSTSRDLSSVPVTSE